MGRGAWPGARPVAAVVTWALLAAGCWQWTMVPVDDVRAGRAHLHEKWVRLHTSSGPVILRVSGYEPPFVVGNQEDGKLVRVDFRTVTAVDVDRAPAPEREVAPGSSLVGGPDREAAALSAHGRTLRAVGIPFVALGVAALLVGLIVSLTPDDAGQFPGWHGDWPVITGGVGLLLGVVGGTLWAAGNRDIEEARARAAADPGIRLAADPRPLPARSLVVQFRF